jgi:nucleoside-diphosphate-sugar epimerase
MNVLVTGAAGFLGRYVVATLIRRGHRVKAVVRPTTDTSGLAWSRHPSAEIVRADLRRPGALGGALDRVDCVVHLAAEIYGDFYGQLAGTVVTTENLLAAMRAARVTRLVLTSTFFAYDYQALGVGDLLDEDSPVDRDPVHAIYYTQTKLMQERLCREFEAEASGRLTVLRPGIVYGRESLWHGLLGQAYGNTLLRIASNSRMPLTYVENCADAVVLAAEREEAIGATLNIVDDDLVSRRTYTRQIRRRMPEGPRVVSINWTLIRLVARLAWFVNRVVFGYRAAMPDILVPARLHPRFKPLRYSNRRAKAVLGWSPRFPLEAAMDRACSSIDLIAVPDGSEATRSHDGPALPSAYDLVVEGSAAK